MECAAAYGPGYYQRLKKAQLVTMSEHLAKLQTIFNRYIRLRDQLLPCISCGRYHQGQWHAGHYKPVGGRSGSALRFNEDNCHRQCSVCNDRLSGNLSLYRLGLIEKIGLARVEWLEGPHEAKKWTIEEIQDLRALYKGKIKDIQAYLPADDGF